MSRLSTSEQTRIDRDNGVICRFGELELVSGSRMLKELNGLKIEDDEDITAMMIIVGDDNNLSERVGGCILIDKDGTCSHYLPEHPNYDFICEATLGECLKMICDHPEAATEFFMPCISKVLGNIKEGQ